MARPGFMAPHHDTPHLIVAIPAHDEAAHIGPCLRAIAGQAQHVLLLVNNTCDRTSSVAREVAADVGLTLTIVERRFAPGRASAGHARHVAMTLAARAVDPGGVLLTTDADGCVAPDWVSANLHHIRAGADAVAGRALIDPVDAAAIPARLHEDDARECAYAALLDEVASLLDPDPADPWPRHSEHSGASICLSADALRRAGGVPDVPMGEDRALFAALRRVDASVRHAPEVTVTVSGRIVGRARGGMADTIRRRLRAPDLFLDDTLEPVRDATRRVRLRARVRRLHSEPAPNRLLADRVARDLGLPEPELRRNVATRFFGEAWAALEARCPVLARSLVPVSELSEQTAEAQLLVAALRVSPVRRTDPSDMSRSGDARLA